MTGSSTSRFCRYGRNAFGTTTEPSACWWVSRIATIVRGIATSVPFSVAIGFTPPGNRPRMSRRRVWKAIDRYSKDYVELQAKDKVRFYKTPDPVLARQLVIYDEAAAKRKDNALFVEIEESQRQFAARAVRWFLDTQVNARMAYNHYFAKQASKPAAPAAKPEAKKS